MINLLEEYKRINGSYKKKFIYHFGTGMGFYSEFNNMILTMLYCLQNNIQFQLYSKDAQFAFGKGWNEFFIPFCSETSFKFHHKFNRRDIDTNKKHGKLLLTGAYIYKMLTGNYLTSDFFYYCRTTWFEKTEFYIPDLNISGDIKTATAQLIKIIYNFNDTYSALIKDSTSSIKLPNSYIAFHIRGGDKIIERQLITYDEYIETASKYSNIRSVFILTDDYTIFEEIKLKYPDWNFYTLTFPDERGYNNKTFMNSTEKRKKAELVKVFSSIEIIKNSQLFLGTYSSNPGMFLGMIMDGGKMIGMDFDKWIIL